MFVIGLKILRDKSLNSTRESTMKRRWSKANVRKAGFITASSSTKKNAANNLWKNGVSVHEEVAVRLIVV